MALRLGSPPPSVPGALAQPASPLPLPLPLPPPLPPPPPPIATGPSTAANRNRFSDPIMRNALRYTISAREYALLHKYIISRSKVLRRTVPTVDRVQRIMDGDAGAGVGAGAVAGRRARGNPHHHQQHQQQQQQPATGGGSDAYNRRPAGGRGGGGSGGKVGSHANAAGSSAGGAALVTAASMIGADDYNARAIRHSIRVFIATGTVMKLWEVVAARLTRGKKQATSTSTTTPRPVHKKSSSSSLSSDTFRLSLSLSTILLLYRLLFRFLTRLRAHLLDPSAAPFRLRNPRATVALTSPYAPAAGASLAGLALAAYPARSPLRVSVALFALFRALEFGWNCAEDNGMIWGWEKVGGGGAAAAAARAAGNGGGGAGAGGAGVAAATAAVAAAAATIPAKGEMLAMGGGGKEAAGVRMRKRQRPWWWGSWMLQPLAFGQLLHAVVFDRDCFPKPYGDFIFSHSTAYLQPKPADYPAKLKWPATYEIVDSLAKMAKLKWPPFVSPILFPNKEDTLPAGLEAIAPITSGAHPLIRSLSCATLHPSDPSCTRTFLTFWLRTLPPLGRLMLAVHAAALLPSGRLWRGLHDAPVATLHRLVAGALRTAAFATGSMATAWASICFFQQWFPRLFLPTQRFFLGGFLAGFWALVEQRRRRRYPGRVGPSSGRPVFLYSARASVDSLWKVGVKRRWWRAVSGGDVWVFVLALLVTGVVYERDARAVREAGWRRGISWVRGEGWRDWGVEPHEVEGGDSEAEEEEEAAEGREGWKETSTVGVQEGVGGVNDWDPGL